MRAAFFSGVAPLILCHATIVIASAARNTDIDRKEVNLKGPALRGVKSLWDARPAPQQNIEHATPTTTHLPAQAHDRTAESPAREAEVLDSLSACLLLVHEDIYYKQNGEPVSVIPLDRRAFESGLFIQDGTLTSCSEEAIHNGTCHIFSGGNSHVVCELCRFLDDAEKSLHSSDIAPCRRDVVDIAMKCLDGPCIGRGPHPKELHLALEEKRSEGRDLLFADSMIGAEKSQWMTSLHNKGLMKGITLKDMVLPGSHNSAAVSLDANKHCGRIDLHFDGLANEVAQNQDITLAEQLRGGIRFLDLRVIENESFYGRKYPLHHSYLIDGDYTNTLFGAFDDIERFLESNPLETLVVRVDGYSGCKDGTDHKTKWKAEIESRTHLQLMMGKHLTAEMSDLKGIALIDIDRSHTLEYWPGTDFGANTLNDNSGPFMYGEYYRNKYGDANMFSIWDFYPNIDEVDVAQTLANLLFDGLEDWDKPYSRHMWVMHSLIGLRAMEVNTIMTDRVGSTPVFDVATRLTLYRIIERNFPSSWDSVGTRDFVNAYDQEFEHHCPPRYVLQGFESYHDDGSEDRRWKFVCRRVSWLDSASYFSGGSSSSSFERGQYHPSAFRTDFDSGGGTANEYDRDVNFYWADGGFAVTGMGGKHSNRVEDRKFYFYASKVTKSGTPSCSWTEFVNDLDGPMDYQTGMNEWIAGVASHHKDYNEDRRWKFYVCR